MYRVTSVIGKLNEWWVGEEDLAHAAQRGTLVHKFCLDYAGAVYFVGGEMLPQELQGYYLSFKNWFDEYVVEVIAVEPELVFLDLVGHPDLICRIKGDTKPTVVDLKTSATMMKIFRLQLASYKKLATENGYNIGRIGGLQLKADGSPARFKPYTRTYEQDWAIVLSMLNIERWLASD